MKALILAAGYGTRLAPLTDVTAKPLLPVAGRPMMDHLYEQIADGCGVSEVHVVANHKFSAAFRAWASRRRGLPTYVHDDGTTCNADRLGAIGDLLLALERGSLADDDLLVVAGDNLFEYRLAELVSFFREAPTSSVLAVHRCPDLDLVRQYSSLTLDATGRVTSFVEKPAVPTSTLVGTAAYVFRRAHLGLVSGYLDAGGAPDQPGRWIEWLYSRVTVRGYCFDGFWLDIGSHAELRRADLLLRPRTERPGSVA
jgi:glucose-1-phosphate thymidylyltransferase